MTNNYKGTPNVISNEHKGDFNEMKRIQDIRKTESEKVKYYRKFLQSLYIQKIN